MVRCVFKIGTLVGLIAAAGCATPKYAYHTVYALKGCKTSVSRDSMERALARSGYLRASEAHGPYDVFHRPEIVKKGPLAVEPFEDKAGDMAVAVCSATPESYVLVEEWRSCKDHKDCTKENQHDLKKVAENWGCAVSEKSGHSRSWNLEDRQDWTKESCSNIATTVTF